MKKGYIITVVMVFAILPFVLNEIMKLESIRNFVGTDTDWLSFWGNYLGGITSASIALFILWITYNQNERENRNNRNLQIKTIEYQRQKDWFDKFNNACIEYVFSFNTNDLADIGNYVGIDPFRVSQTCKYLLERLVKANTGVSFLMPTDPSKAITEFNEIKGRYYNEYGSIIMDIQFCNGYLSTLQKSTNAPTISGLLKFSQDFSPKFKQYAHGRASKVPQPTINSLLMDYILSRQDLFEEVSDEAQRYLNLEKERINKMLTDK